MSVALNLQDYLPRQEWPQDESALRVELAAAYRLIDRFGLSDLVDTHISVRLPGTDSFLINPYGLLFSEITASSLVKVDLQGNRLEPSVWPLNPAGFIIHGAVYPVRPDAQCVLHTHSRYVMAVSTLECGLLPLSQMGLQFYNRIAYHDYEGASLDFTERERLAHALGNHRVMLLRNHGLLTVGRTVAEAFYLAYYMEKACEIQIMAQSTGAPLVQPSPEICEKAAVQQDTEILSGLQWQALIRLLEREEPGYRE